MADDARTDANVITEAADDGRLPLVDVRVVLFTVADGELLVALQSDGSRWHLPRGLPFAGISLDAAARTIIHEATHLHEQYLEQLYTLSLREAPRWSVIVCYIALLPSEAAGAPNMTASWRPIREATLNDADRMVFDYALMRLRAKLGYTTIAFHLLPATFTLSELQSAYEAVLGRPLDKRNFRRRMIAAGILEGMEEKRRDGSHRPAQLYRFRAGHDPAAFLTPSWAGDV